MSTFRGVRTPKSKSTPRSRNRVSSPVALSLSHSDLERLIHARGMEVMRQLLQGHVDLRGAGEALEPIETSEGAVLGRTCRSGRRRS